MTINQVMLGVFIILSSYGCTLAYPYHYISLVKVPDIQVLEHGISERDIENHELMPIYYKIERNLYIIYLIMDTKYPSPRIRIQARTQNAIDLEIVPGKKYGCGKFYVESQWAGARYTWAKDFDRACAFYDSDRQIIHFHVFDREGVSLGEEKLRFSLIRNGTAFVIDAP
ncbi:MAG: hypothetical protein HOM97_02995 [Nitrospina sp.]|nr:hypothetical protein [Nitrospina sp.]